MSWRDYLPGGTTDPETAVDQAKTKYVQGDLSHNELESRLDRAMEIEKEERQKEREIARELQDGSPSTLIDSGGTVGKHEFEQQELGQSELREIKEIRESGGIVAQLVQARALLEFGTGAEFQSESDEVSEWLHEEFDNLDNLVIDLAEDALWFPRSFGEVVETRGGDFSHVELVEPWTMIPETNQFGEILHWVQEVQAHDAPEKTYQPDDIASFLLTKSSGRDSVGVSTVWRAKDEIQQFMDNKRSIGNAIELAGFPHMHWKVGRDDAAIIDDNELRRVRNKVQRLDSDSHIITGTDVQADQIQPTTFDFTQITQHDLRQVAISLGVPLEVASVISEGLGSGAQSDVRRQMFERQARADQRALAGQFVEQVVRPVLEQYSPYNPENVDVTLKFGDPIQDPSKKQDEIDAIGDDMTVNERRSLYDREPVDDEEVGEGYQSASEQEAPDDQSDGIGGIFQDSVENALDERELEDGGTDFSNLENVELDQYPEWERAFLELQRNAHTVEPDARLLAFSGSAVPEFVKERLRDAVFSGVVYSDFEDLSSPERRDLQEQLIETLTSDQWTIDGMSDQIQQLGVDPENADMIARTEVGEIAKTGRQFGYVEKGLDDDPFYWVGDLGDRTTDTCKYLIAGTSADLENPGAFSGLDRPDGTNPHHGGKPIDGLENLQDHVHEVAKADPEFNTNPRGWTPHIQCRKDYVRFVDG